MQQPFTVIRGGKELPTASKTRTFLQGWATDTRLMGVVGLDLTWEVLKNTHFEKIHQVFYLDCEEFGIESFLEGYGDNPAEIEEERTRLYSSLGGSHVPVSEKEARFLIQMHACINDRYRQPLPEGRDKYAFLLNQEQNLTAEEYCDLFERICGDDRGANYLINYFLMRCVAGDAPGAHWLLTRKAPMGDRPVRPSDLPDLSDCTVFYPQCRGTLCRNSIQTAGLPEDNTYFCEALMEYNNQYHLSTSMFRLDGEGTKILSVTKRSDFKVTGVEAAMLVNRSEYVAVYDILSPDEEFDDMFYRFTSAYTETQYENGRLYIEFNPTNDHVGQPVYLINNDIHAMYFLTDDDQVLIMGYSLEAVQSAEFRLFLSMMPYAFMGVMKYEFREPVFYEYLRSPFADFSEFLDSLGVDTDPE